ncbi:folate-binding protein YgfZ [soil metagenome]
MTGTWVRTRRDGLLVEGTDATTYLHSQLSQEVRDLQVGESRWTLVLVPTGHVQVLARVWRRSGEQFVLDTEPGFGQTLRAQLAKFMIRVKATLTEVSLEALEPVVPGSDEPPNEGAVVGWWGRGVVLLDESAPALPDGASEGSLDDLEHARVAAGWPVMGREIVPGERLPAELGVSSVAVNFKKGCYPGQELVERMDSRGAQAPRQLRRLAVDEGASAGDPIEVDGAELGRLTSVAGRQALGFVKRNADIGEPVAPT